MAQRDLSNTIIEMMQDTARNMKAQPVNLGGISGAGGGEGGPPGGFIGWLLQTRVAYDTDEAATLDTVGSGTLLDNLNHIRYRIETLEASSGILTVDEIDGSPSVELVQQLTFSGAIVTEVSPGHALVQITSSSGSGTPLVVQEIDGSPVVSNVDKIIFSGAIVTDLGGGDALVQITPNTILAVQDGNFTPVSNVTTISMLGATVVDGGGGEALVFFPTLTVKEFDGSPEIDNVDTIIFSGASVTDLGSGDVLVTISGSGPHTHEVDQLSDIFNDAEGDPADIAPTPADGTSIYAARRDHVHRVDYKLIGFGPFQVESPITTHGLFPFVTSIGETTTLLKWVQNVYVVTTNTGANYWTIYLTDVAGATIASFNTSALSANNWHQTTVTSFSINPIVPATHKQIQVQVLKTGAPGSLYVACPWLEYR
jgi:hypothetical protein